MTEESEERAFVSIASDNLNQPAQNAQNWGKVTGLKSQKATLLSFPEETLSVGYYLIKVVTVVYLFMLLCGLYSAVCG